MKLRTIIALSLGISSIAAYADTTPSVTNSATPPQATTAPASGAAATSAPASGTITLNTEMDKVSYAIGVDIGQNFKTQGIAINSDAIAQGIRDGLAGTPPLLSQKDMEATLLAFQKELLVKRQQQFQNMSAQNKQEGDAYLAANKTKPGVVTLPDGLQYKIITDGTGTPPTDQDTVTVNYEGTFVNGKIFDSSYQRGKSVTFPVSEVIPGWTEALKLMKPGATWQIAIPPSLAYGERGIGPVGPNETLLFKVNLISVNKGGAAQNAPAPTATPTQADNQSSTTQANAGQATTTDTNS